MMKWRRRRSGSFDYVDSKGGGGSLAPPSDQSVDETDPFSPYEDLHLEDLYKKFRSKSHSDSSLAELENSLELYQNINSPTSTPKRQYCRQKSNDKSRPQVFLPSIDEHDELLSIADSGISCDADDESENDDNFHKKQRSYFLPLKGGDEFDFGIHEEKNESSLLSCINEELFKRSNSDSSELLVKELENTHTSAKSIEHQNNFDIPDNPKHKHRLQRQYGVIDDPSDAYDVIESEKAEKFGLIRSPTTDNVLSEMADGQNNLINSPTNDNILSEIDVANRQIFHRLKLKADLDQPLNTVERPDTLPYSLMSSLIWSGETSRHYPSPIEIYSTMPPNRYIPATPNDVISRDEQDGGNEFDFVVHLNVSQYGPDEILVTLEDGKVVVNGKHFSESEYGFESCQFHRQYPIPDGIKKSDIKSKISEDGILTITARRFDNKTRNINQAKRGSRDLELLTLPARSFSTGHEDRPTTPVLKSPKSPASPSNIKGEIEFKDTNKNTYQAKIPCGGYKPEDLDVRVSDMGLSVSGRQKIISGDKQIKHKEFTKTINIPEDGDPNSITSRFLQNTLIIEVSKLKRRSSTGNILNTL